MSASKTVRIYIEEEEDRAVLAVAIGKTLRQMGASVNYAGPGNDLLTDYDLERVNLSQYQFHLIPVKRNS